MSSVATKSRAKVADKSPGAKPALEILNSKLSAVQNLITQALDAAEAGSSIELLLRHLDEVLLPDAFAPLRYQGTVTKTHAAAIYEAMHLPLALIESAMALAAGTVLLPTLNEAHSRLDEAQSALDSTEKLVRALPAADPATDFARGRDIAINMLDEADSLLDEREGMRWMRNGQAQHNFFKGYLTDVINEPSLMSGFSAVMSTTIRNDQMDLSELKKITLAETQAGEVGGDGTFAGPDWVGSVEPAQHAAAGYDSSADNAGAHYAHALALIEKTAHEQQECLLIFGARNLLRHGDKPLSDGIRDGDADALNISSQELEVVLGVLSDAAERAGNPDDACVWGIVTLVELCKTELDAYIHRLEAKEAA